MSYLTPREAASLDHWLTTEPDRPDCCDEMCPKKDCHCGGTVCLDHDTDFSTRWTKPVCDICGDWVCDDCVDESLGYPVHREGCLERAAAERIARGEAA